MVGVINLILYVGIWKIFIIKKKKKTPDSLVFENKFF